MGYAICHTSRVKNTNTGGRLHSAVHTASLDNGSVVFLGGLVVGSTEIHQAVVPTTALITAGATPMLVMSAEIIYDQSKMSSGALGNYTNIAEKSFPLIPLLEFDEIEISVEGFVGTPVKGKFVTLANASAKWNVVDTKPVSGFYGEITSVRKSSLPVFIGGQGTRFPVAYDLFTLSFAK